ncbi:hypothetical protein JMJ55_25355 [Belnapia sp. T6]|uniref:Uncharacterized protein n=1 Tax=Belnapia mucosa TaxID=2804532 RepID=A0ABS1VAI0_9PROT|nr:hypothetical protein [Belnapia mucosa]MBL6458668.1 hypothetical protein [Belnapia mucosa]
MPLDSGALGGVLAHGAASAQAAAEARGAAADALPGGPPAAPPGSPGSTEVVVPAWRGQGHQGAVGLLDMADPVMSAGDRGRLDATALGGVPGALAMAAGDVKGAERFRALMAHEYVEVRLMEQGVPYISPDPSVWDSSGTYRGDGEYFGAHDLAPNANKLPNQPRENLFSHYPSRGWPEPSEKCNSSGYTCSVQHPSWMVSRLRIAGLLATFRRYSALMEQLAPEVRIMSPKNSTDTASQESWSSSRSVRFAGSI